MKYNMQFRESKYLALQQFVRDAGYLAEILPGHQTDFISFRPNDLADKWLSFKVAVRESGTFLLFFRPHAVYQHTANADRLGPLCLEVLELLSQHVGPFCLPTRIAQKYELEPVDRSLWNSQEDHEHRLKLARWGWTVVPDHEDQIVRDEFEKRFSAVGSRYLKEPVGSEAWEISTAYLPDGTLYEQPEWDFYAKTLQALKDCTPIGERFYVFHWYSCTWLFDPHKGNPDAECDYWGVEILRSADPCYVVSQDFASGLFKRYPEDEVCVFGSALLSAVVANKPSAFGEIVRVDGEKVNDGVV